MTSEAQGLLARIHRRYQTTENVVTVGAVQFQFTRIQNPDTVLDQVAAEEDRRERDRGRRTPSDELHLPYWAELWDSALGIATWMESRGRSDAGNALTGKTILDLGCGMGLAGTAAAALGAHVTFADLEPPALLFARLNSLPWRDRIITRRLDWQRDRLEEKFDLILGSDILYERAQWEFLEPFWTAHLKENGSVLLGEPGRQTGELFVSWITGRGWNLTETGQPVPGRARPIRLFTLTRK